MTRSIYAVVRNQARLISIEKVMFVHIGLRHRMVYITSFILASAHFTLVAMEKHFPLVLFLSLTFVFCGASAGKVGHCVYGTSVQDLLKLAGIKGGNLVVCSLKLKQHNIDQTVLPSLSLQHLNDIGITSLGDRLKIHNFFSKDANDCSSSRCKNNGLCRDGFRCFSCICDPKSGYYGPSCERKCPCKNGGHCKTVPTGFKCVCPPGYSGDLCDTMYLTEERIIKLEETLKQVSKYP